MGDEYDDQDGAPQKEVGGKSDAEYERDIRDRESRVQQTLNMGNAAGAIELALTDPPVFSKNQQLKDRNAAVVVNALVSIKEKDIDTALAKLSDDQLDVCMKYIYRGLESGDNSNILLKWHESVYNKCGIGCIIRAIAERRTV